VFVGGERADLRELRDGDELQIGTVRLRFELVQLSPLALLMDLLARYQEDPVKAFKEDPRLRTGLAVFLTAIILVVVSLSRGGPAEASVDQSLVWLEDGTRKLAQRDWAGARDDMRKAMARGEVATEHMTMHRSIVAVASQWADRKEREGDWFMRFNWRKADELLQQAAAVRGLPDDTLAWLREQQQWVARHRAAYDQLGTGQALAANAAELVQQGALTQAVQTYREALSAYQTVDPSTPMAAQGKESATLLRRQVHELLAGELRRRMGAAIPDWDECKQLAAVAVEFTASGDERTELRRIEEECDRNRRDEDRYRQAVDIVNARDLVNYRVAIDMLEKVDPGSRIHPDARAYLDWIDADLKVREAKKAYDQGEDRRAFDLLREAMKYEVLGPEARLSVQNRRQSWLTIINSWRRGMGLYQEGKSAEAKAQLEKVIQLETNRDNWYYRQARSQLVHIAEREAYSLERRLREGLVALDKAQYEQSLQWFNEVRSDPNHRPSDLDKIREKVVEVKRARRMVSEAKRMIMAGRDDTLPLYYSLMLLREWLPASDKDRPEVEKMFEKVKTRLNLLLKNARAKRPAPPR
jgi:tetratricopeptide (TPR) repeat protein